jgi:hypothetical protein
LLRELQPVSPIQMQIQLSWKVAPSDAKGSSINEQRPEGTSEWQMKRRKNSRDRI